MFSFHEVLTVHSVLQLKIFVWFFNLLKLPIRKALHIKVALVHRCWKSSVKFLSRLFVDIGDVLIVPVVLLCLITEDLLEVVMRRLVSLAEEVDLLRHHFWFVLPLDVGHLVV
jgi:hypothetical protein